MNIGLSLLQEMKINYKLFVLNYQVFYIHIYIKFKNKSQEITLVKNDEKCVPMHPSLYFCLLAHWLESGTHLELFTGGGAVPMAIRNLCLI